MNYLTKLLFFPVIIFQYHVCHGGHRHDHPGAQVVDSVEVDDTKYLQSLIDNAQYGDTIVLPRDTFYVHTLHLRSGVSVRALGLLKQLPAKKEENFTNSKQYSSHPLFSGINVRQVYLSFHAQTKQEAVFLENCSDIRIDGVKTVGDSTKLYSFAGMYFSHCNGISVKNSEIAYYGKERQKVKSYQPGTGIRVQTSENIAIQHNTIHHNGENGVFTHSSSKVAIEDNSFHHNGMSGIQVAFGRVQREKHYLINRNILNQNGADGIDINNPNTKRPVSLEAVIEDNSSDGNGWVREHSTPDGSGIATLIGLRKVLLKNNRSTNSNRPGLYIDGCDSITAIGNEADNVAEIVGKLGNIRLHGNTFSGVRLMASVNAQKLKLDSNDIHHLSFPSGITIDSLIVRSNELKGNVNINMVGNLVFKGNNLYSPAATGAISLIKVTSATLTDNHIQSTKAHALMVSPLAKEVIIKENKIHAAQACVADRGSYNLRLIRNSMNFLDEVEEEAPFIVSINPNFIHLEANEYFQGGKRVYRAPLIEGGGEVLIKYEQFL